MDSNFNLEALLGCKLEDADRIIANIDDHISYAKIPKKSGGLRTITMPSDELKKIQENILKNVLYQYHAHEASHGFVVGRSIVTGARVHTYQRSVFGADIKSFFDNINTNHMKNVLYGNERICRLCKKKGTQQCCISLYESVAREERGDELVPCEEVLALHDPNFLNATGYKSLFKYILDLCIYQDKAPQGFPTSPAIGNIVLKGFDNWAQATFKDMNLVYTRYADDITISSSDMETDVLVEAVLKPIRHKLYGFGFELNKDKTRCIGSGRRQVVTGITVNNGCSIGRGKKRLFRAIVHSVVTGRVHKTREELMELKGNLSFMAMVKPKHIRYLIWLNRFLVEKKYILLGEPLPEEQPAEAAA